MIFNLQTCQHHQSSIILLNLWRAAGFYWPLKSFNTTSSSSSSSHMGTTLTKSCEAELSSWHFYIVSGNEVRMLLSQRRSRSWQEEIPPLPSFPQHSLSSTSTCQETKQRGKTGNKLSAPHRQRLGELSGCRGDDMRELNRLRVTDKQPQLHLREI